MRQKKWPPSGDGGKGPRYHALYLLGKYGYSRSQAYDIVERLQEPYSLAQLPEQELVRLLTPPPDLPFPVKSSPAGRKREAIRITSTKSFEIEDPLLPNKVRAYAEWRRIAYPRQLADLMQTRKEGAARRAIQRERAKGRQQGASQ